MERGSHRSPAANADKHRFFLLSAIIRVACIRVIRVQTDKTKTTPALQTKISKLGLYYKYSYIYGKFKIYHLEYIVFTVHALKPKAFQ